VSKNQTIGVLAGGDSPEREVSFVSGRSVHQALEVAGMDARLVLIDDLDALFPALAGIDVAFNVLHGGSGEDGTVQLLLDVMGIPYAGSGPLACARAMDKARAKEIFRTMRVPTPPGITATQESSPEDLQRGIGLMQPPFVVKPAGLGSTLGISFVDSVRELEDAVASSVATFGDTLIEPFISGRELTVGILRVDGEDIPLPLVEIRFPTELFDFQAKYESGVSEFLVPADLPDSLAREIQAIALRAHEVLGCFGYSRVDFRLSEDNDPYVLEVNTLPGMTPLSDLPRAAAAAGIDFEQLVQFMLQTAQKPDASAAT